MHFEMSTIDFHLKRINSSTIWFITMGMFYGAPSKVWCTTHHIIQWVRCLYVFIHQLLGIYSKNSYVYLPRHSCDPSTHFNPISLSSLGLNNEPNSQTREELSLSFRRWVLVENYLSIYKKKGRIHLIGKSMVVSRNKELVISFLSQPWGQDWFEGEDNVTTLIS